MNILILSDFVGCGNVAMGVARSVLTHMGHNALCLPTALISNTWNLGAPAVLDTTGLPARSPRRLGAAGHSAGGGAAGVSGR